MSASPFPSSPDPKGHESHSEDHDSSHHHHHHRKRDRVVSFVKHLASPFSHHDHHDHHHHGEPGSPSSSTTSLGTEHGPVPHLLRKRKSGNSVKSDMKNPPSPSPSPFSSPDVSRISQNSNHSNPEIDHQGSPTRKRERVRSFVSNVRRTSSQMFKKDKKDGRPHSTLAALAAESLSISTAATTPTILRRFSHSKHPSATSTTTTGSDLSENYSEVRVVSDKGSLTSPIIEVATPITPAVVQPVDVTPVILLEEPARGEDVSPETKPKEIQSLPPYSDDPQQVESQPTGAALETPDPLLLPLPLSPVSSPSLIVDPVEPIQTSMGNQEVNTTPHNETAHHYDTPPPNDMVLRHDTVPLGGAVPHDNRIPQGNATSHDDPASHNGEGSESEESEESKVSSPQDQTQPQVTTVAASTTPPLDHTSQSSSTLPSPPASAQLQQDLCVPVVIPPMMFWPISNMRLSYFFTPVLTWWLSKGVVNYPSVYS